MKKDKNADVILAISNLMDNNLNKQYNTITFNEKILEQLSFFDFNGEKKLTLDRIKLLISKYQTAFDPLYLQQLALEVVLNRSYELLELSFYKLKQIDIQIIYINAVNYIIHTLRSKRNGFGGAKHIWEINDIYVNRLFYDALNQLHTIFNKDKLVNRKIKSDQVTIVLNLISPIKNQTGTKLYLDYIAALANNSQIKKVNILITYEETLGQKRNYSLFSWRNKKFDILERISSEYLFLNSEALNKINVIDSLRDCSTQNYLLNLDNILEQLRSDVFVCFEYKFSLVLSLISKLFPLVYVPIQLGLPPKGMNPTFECIMSHDPRVSQKLENTCQIQKQISYPLFDDEYCDFPYRQNKQEIIMLTAAYELDKRVDSKYMESFLDMLVRVLTLNENSKFIFLGINKKNGAALFDRHEKAVINLSVVKERIIFIEKEANFTSFVKQCDIFLMPRHKGGGRSIRTALNEGLAVLTLDKNDGNLYMPTDYIFPSEKEMESYLISILVDEPKLQFTKDKCKAHFNDIDNGETIDNFLKIVHACPDAFLKKKVLLAGDSHARSLKKLTLPEGYSSRSAVVDGATLSGLSNPNSITGSFGKFQNAYAVGNFDYVIYILGEVDTGFLLWYYSEREGVDVKSYMKKALDNYILLVQDTLEYANNVILVSVPLPTITDDYAGAGEVQSLRKSIKATQKQRTELTLEFNTQIKAWCENFETVQFIDLDTLSLDKDNLIKKELKNDDPHDHHYNQSAYLSLLGPLLTDKLMVI